MPAATRKFSRTFPIPRFLGRLPASSWDGRPGTAKTDTSEIVKLIQNNFCTFEKITRKIVAVEQMHTFISLSLHMSVSLSLLSSISSFIYFSSDFYLFSHDSRHACFLSSHMSTRFFFSLLFHIFLCLFLSSYDRSLSVCLSLFSSLSQ